VVDKCVNPDCSKPFRYLRGGRLFRFEMPPGRAADRNEVEHFWLCPECCNAFTLKLRRGELPELLSLPTRGAKGERCIPVTVPDA
jgi:hypothetical protein